MKYIFLAIAVIFFLILSCVDDFEHIERRSKVLDAKAKLPCMDMAYRLDDGMQHVFKCEPRQNVEVHFAPMLPGFSVDEDGDRRESKGIIICRCRMHEQGADQ